MRLSWLEGARRLKKSSSRAQVRGNTAGCYEACSMSYAFEREAAVLGSRLMVRSLPLCPEVKLWLLGDDVDLNRSIPELLQIERAPYWAFCWGSGQALARFVLDNPELVRGRRVADFGAGCGVASIAARVSGA